MEVFKSNKGKNKIAFRGYSYRKNTTNVTTQNWRCDIKSCLGTVSTAINYKAEGVVPVEKRSHNHPPDPARTQVLVAVDKMTDTAATSNAPPRRIISATTINLTADAQSIVPKRKALRVKIQRKRRQIKIGHEPEPTSHEFPIPDRLKSVTHAGHEGRFLLHDDFEQIDEFEEGSDNDRITVFASDRMLGELRNASTWMLDGTFKVVPSLCFQLYTIHAIRGSHVLPCVYALLPNKTTATYKRLFQILKGARNDLNPQTCITDLERTAVNALREEFHGVSVQVCFFHLSQAIWRQIQRLGLTNAYLESLEVRTTLKNLCSLAFLPHEEVVEGFEQSEDALEDIDPDISDVYTYFEDTYIGRPNRGGNRRNAVFAPNLWNVRQRTQDGLPRTNNKLEGWNRAIQTLLDGPHPSIWRFFSAIQKEEGLQDDDLTALMAGQEIQKQKKYKDVNDRLKILIENYDNDVITREEFVRGVSHNINLNT